MSITDLDPETEAFRRFLLSRPSRTRLDRPLDVQVRPVSEEWRLAGRRPAYRTAVANVAYIWRDSDVADRFGPMPASFAERRCELHGAGLILPGSAPKWATQGYTIWQEADEATVAASDPMAVAAWHVMAEIPTTIPPDRWPAMTTGFVERELAAKGAVIAWAVHALAGADDNWIVRPHVHLCVTARGWRTGPSKGRRHPAWLGWNRAQWRLATSWRTWTARVKTLRE